VLEKAKVNQDLMPNLFRHLIKINRSLRDLETRLWEQKSVFKQFVKILEDPLASPLREKSPMPLHSISIKPGHMFYNNLHCTFQILRF
jgi:hypothetical protein